MNNIKKPTNQLLSELASADSICEFLKSNSDVFIDKNLAELLSRLLETKGLNKSAVLKKAEINDIYGHQIFSGGYAVPQGISLSAY